MSSDGPSHGPPGRRYSTARGLSNVGMITSAPSRSSSSARLPTVTRRRRALEHTRADEVALDLDRARADAQPADVAVHALDRVLAREAVAAQQLNRLVAHEFRGEV